MLREKRVFDYPVKKKLVRKIYLESCKKQMLVVYQGILRLFVAL